MSKACWYEEPRNLATLFRWMDEGNVDFAVDPQHFLDEPHSYDAEWSQMLQAELEDAHV